MSKLSEQRPIQRRATLALYLGTAAVAVLAVSGGYLADAAALRAQRDTLVLLDLVREQQGLAQRIILLSVRGAEGDQASEFQRWQVTHRFARNHEALRQADQELGVSASSAAAFRAVYAEGDRPLAMEVQRFLDGVRSKDTGAPKDRGSDEARMTAEFIGETFPNRLDALAKAFLRTTTGRVDTLHLASTILSGVGLLSLLIQGLTIAWPLWRWLGRYDERVTAIGVTDPVTGALTALSFATRAGDEIRRARRYRRPVSVMTIATALPTGTIDAAALRALYGHLSETLRPSDLIGLREGGFSVILPETDLYAAELAGQRILRELDLRPIAVNGEAAVVDVRIGAAQVRADEGSPEAPLARAAAALQEARSAGGDRVALSAQRELRSTAS